MKKIIKIVLLFPSLLLLVMGCEQEEKLPLESITNALGTAGGLRTINIGSPTFNFLDKNNTEFSVDVEEWDAQDGDLLESVDVLVAFTDNSPENGDNTMAATLVKNVPASDFAVDSSSRLPRTTLTVSLVEVANALGLDIDDDILSNDTFRVNLSLNLSDGTVFNSSNFEGNITGAFFNSPFTYPVQFSCPIEDASLFQGTYIVTRDDWADYGVGNEIPVVLGEDPFTFRILSTNNPFIANPDTSYMELTINPDDGTVTVQSNECFNYGPGFCLPVTGTGSIGSCTGSIDITIDFSPSFPGNVFRLAKK
nr:hypothetical protein [uncultured Allomuricauda sp.]